MLRFDPPVVEAGEATTLIVQARDDLTGVKTISGEIRSPNGRALLPFNSRSTGGAITSTFRIPIPREAEAGDWYVTWIAVTDGADNSTMVRASSAALAPPGSTLTLIPPLPTPPRPR